MPDVNEEATQMHPAFEELLVDIRDNTKRAEKAKALETKHELAENVWPMLKAIVEAVNTRFEEVEETVEEYLAEEGNVIYSDLAEPLFGLLALARKVAGELLTGEMSDLKLQALRVDARAMLATIEILEPMAAQAVVGDAPAEGEEEPEAEAESAEGEEKGDE